jgi:shikimate kinase
MAIPERHIVIVGFMGSGKTSVGRELACKLNRPAVDLDEIITRDRNALPAEIITQSGETEFRRLESKALAEVLAQPQASVIATGGGAWTREENRKQISDAEALTIWLDAPFELCWKRIEANKELRPLAPSREEASALFNQRQSAYRLADLTIPVLESDDVQLITAEISRRLQSQR